VSGSGTVTTAAGSKVLTFSAAQSFKEGATIYISDGNGVEKLTIDTGSGTSWNVMQNAAASASGRSFQTSDPSATARGRGTSGQLVPNATHYVYQSMFDDAGNPDLWVYVDTLFSENGLHPYTLDRVVGSFKTAKTVSEMIPALNVRVRRLEGALRAGRSSSSLSQDFRLAALVARAYALEQWAGRVGTNSPPTPGSNATYTESDFLSAGDPA
jgi:hypothetical protein